MNQEIQKGDFIKGLFEKIAPQYDLLNILLSFGIDSYWREKAVDELDLDRSHNILDLCTGTGEIALAIAYRREFKGLCFGVDFSFEMLKKAQDKVLNLAAQHNVVWTCADANCLPFEDACFDAAIMGFGIRNVLSLQRSLLEIRRILKPEGRIVLLEFSHPKNQRFRQTYSIYIQELLPAIGSYLSGHEGSYSFLPQSILSFVEPEELKEEMIKAGFTQVAYKSLTAEIVTLWTGSTDL